MKNAILVSVFFSFFTCNGWAVYRTANPYVLQTSPLTDTYNMVEATIYAAIQPPVQFMAATFFLCCFGSLLEDKPAEALALLGVATVLGIVDNQLTTERSVCNALTSRSNQQASVNVQAASYLFSWLAMASFLLKTEHPLENVSTLPTL